MRFSRDWKSVVFRSDENFIRLG